MKRNLLFALGLMISFAAFGRADVSKGTAKDVKSYLDSLDKEPGQAKKIEPVRRDEVLGERQEQQAERDVQNDPFIEDNGNGRTSNTKLTKP